MLPELREGAVSARPHGRADGEVKEHPLRGQS